MREFIKILQSDNKGTYININNIVKFYRKTHDTLGIDTVDGKTVECRLELDDLVKLIDKTSSL